MSTLTTKQKIQLIARLRNSTFIRLVAWPAASWRRWNRMKAYQRSGEGEKLKLLKNIHQGERCFVIGNGPSLTAQDLDKLQDEYTFCTNRIFCIYEQTQWRPSYYFCFDNELVTDEIDRIKSSGNYPKFLSVRAASLGRRPEDNITYVVHYGKFHIDPHKSDMNTLSEDISRYMTYVGSVTVNAIEMAIYMGFKEIYLLGVDHNYMLKVGSNGKIYKDDTVKANYFQGMVDAKGTKGVNYSVMSPDYMNESYRIAKQFAEAHGVRVYNATRGGKLEIFERVDFDELMRRGKEAGIPAVR